MSGETVIKNGLIVKGDSELKNITEIITTNSRYNIGSPVLFYNSYYTSSFRKESIFVGISTVAKSGGPTADIKILRSGSIQVDNDDFPNVTRNGALYLNEDWVSSNGLSSTYTQGILIGSVGGYVAGSGNQFTINITGSSSISDKILNNRDWQDSVLLVIGNGETYTEGGVKPALPSNGDIYVNTLSKSIEVYDGIAWNTIITPSNGDRVLVMASPGAGTYFPTSDSIYTILNNNWIDFDYNYTVDEYVNIYSKYDDAIWTGKGTSGSMVWSIIPNGVLVTAGGGDESLVNIPTNEIKELTAGYNISLSDNGTHITINATDTNTEYTGGNGINIDGSNEITIDIVSGSSGLHFIGGQLLIKNNPVWGIGLNSNGIYLNQSALVSGANAELDGDKLDIDWNPTNYTPVLAAAYTTSLDELTSHLKGIDNSLGLASSLNDLSDVDASDSSKGVILTGDNAGTAFTTSDFTIDDTANAATDVLWSSSKIESAIEDEVKALDWKDSVVYFFSSSENAYTESTVQPAGTEGDMWVNTTNESISIHNGTTWDIISVPTIGDRIVIAGNAGVATRFPTDDVVATFDGTNWTNDQASVNDGVTVFNEYDKIVYRGKGSASPLTWVKVFGGIGSADSLDSSLNVEFVDGVSLNVETLYEQLSIFAAGSVTTSIGANTAVRFDYFLNYDFSGTQVYKAGSITGSVLNGHVTQAHTTTTGITSTGVSNDTDDATIEIVSVGGKPRLRLTSSSSKGMFIHVRAYPIN